MGRGGGRGGVASVRLARLAGSSTLYTALGRDALGDQAFAQLTELGVRVEATRHAEPQRRGFTFVDGDGERTITIIGEKHVPRGEDPLAWGELAGTDGVYFVSGDAAAARAARRARVLVATARVRPVLAEAGVELDALVRSASDPSERYELGDLDPTPRLVVTTAGDEGAPGLLPTGQRGSTTRRPSRARSRTPTAPATASLPGSRTRSPRARITRPRSGSRPARRARH